MKDTDKYKFASGSELTDLIEYVCHGRFVKCAVAFWGDRDPIQLFGQNWRDAEIVCDISMGATTRSALERLGAPNNSNLRVHDGLHAKVYVSDRGAVVASANASNAGLPKSESEGHREAGIFTPPQCAEWEDAKDFIDNLFNNDSYRISETILAHAPIHVRVASNRVSSTEERTILDQIIADPSQFEDMTIIFSRVGDWTGDERSKEKMRDLRLLRLEEKDDEYQSIEGRDLISEGDSFDTFETMRSGLVLDFWIPECNRKEPLYEFHKECVRLSTKENDKIYGKEVDRKYWKSRFSGVSSDRRMHDRDIERVSTILGKRRWLVMTADELCRKVLQVRGEL